MNLRYLLLGGLLALAAGGGCGGSGDNAPASYGSCAVAAQVTLAGCQASSSRPGDYSDCDFSGQNLSNQVLSCLVLWGSDFSNANLSGADLSYTVLTGANLSGADLSNANLTGANLNGVNLYGANLTGAITEGANLPANLPD